MRTYDVNTRGAENARALIRKAVVDDTTEWSDANSISEQDSELLSKHGYDGYAEWHLAADPNASGKRSARYAFPAGDFSKLNKAGLTSAKQRASPYERGKLLEHLGDSGD